MSIISVPNLKEIEAWEGYFYATKIYLQFCAKEKKTVKKIGQFSG